MPSVEQVTYNSPDGATIGQSATEKVSFYGETPVVQAAAITAITTTGASSTTNAYAYTTAAQADAIVASLNAVITALTNIGISA
jgi:hypothetical protein